MAKQPRVWSGSQWEPLAVTLPDLSNYSTTTQMNAAISAAQGLTLINATTFTTSSAVNLNNVFSSTYEHYRVIVRINAGTSTGALIFRMRNAGADRTGGDYHYQNIGLTEVNGTKNDWGAAQTNAYISNYHATYPKATFADFDVMHPFNSSEYTAFAGIQGGVTSGISNYGGVLSGGYDIANSNDGCTIYCASGTISGTVRVYGYK